MWGTLELTENQWSCYKIGKLSLYLKKIGDEILAVSDQKDEMMSFSIDQDCPPADDSGKIRILINRYDTIFQILPSLPNRPIVVSSLSPLRLPPKHEALFYVGIPVSVQLLIGKRKQVLLEEPSELLSNTWYGTPADGILCYKVDSYLLRKPDSEIFVPSTAICPVYIRNNTRDVFDFNRVSIYTPFLNVFGAEISLWTNRVRVTAVSDSRVNVTVDNGAPNVIDGDKAPQLLNTRRETMDKSLLKKSFSIIKTVTGL